MFIFIQTKEDPLRANVPCFCGPGKMCTQPCRAAVLIWLAAEYPWNGDFKHDGDGGERVLIRGQKCFACESLTGESDQVVSSLRNTIIDSY
jgi:hypothetical protein